MISSSASPVEVLMTQWGGQPATEALSMLLLAKKPNLSKPVLISLSYIKYQNLQVGSLQIALCYSSSSRACSCSSGRLCLPGQCWTLSTLPLYSMLLTSRWFVKSILLVPEPAHVAWVQVDSVSLDNADPYPPYSFTVCCSHPDDFLLL